MEGVVKQRLVSMPEPSYVSQLHFTNSTGLLVKSWQVFSGTNVPLFMWIFYPVVPLLSMNTTVVLWVILSYSMNSKSSGFNLTLLLKTLNSPDSNTRTQAFGPQLPVAALPGRCCRFMCCVRPSYGSQPLFLSGPFQISRNVRPT